MPQTRAMSVAQKAANTMDVQETQVSGSKQKAKARKRTTANQQKAVQEHSDTLQNTSQNANISDLPPEMLNEVARHLAPADLLSLARSNKMFRRAFMSHSSAPIWQTCINSINGLPPCPPSLSAPQYISLIYSNTCSECGGRVSHRMDPYLRVRLCRVCKETLTEEREIGSALANLIPASSGSSRKTISFLKRDLQAVAAVTSYSKSKQLLTFATGRIDRSTELAERYKHAKLLDVFLEKMESERKDELYDLKRQRQADIESRLLQKGWTLVEAQFPRRINPEWDRLVFQPKPLTDRIWANIYPKLEPVLGAHRKCIAAAGIRSRRVDRQKHVDKLFSDIRKSLPPLVQVEVDWSQQGDPPRYDEPSTFRINAPFPTTTEVMKWPLVIQLIETDTAVEEMEATFNQYRPKVEKMISDWRAEVDRSVFEILSEGRTNEQNAAPSKKLETTKRSLEKTKQSSSKGKRKARDDSPFSISDFVGEISFPRFSLKYSRPDGTTTSNIDELPNNLQLLLRADTVFLSEGLDYFYPSFIPSPTTTHILYATGSNSYSDEVWDPSTVKRDDDLSHIVHMILEHLGHPDATYAELKSMGNAFVCERCSYQDGVGWNLFVYHYKREISQWKTAQENIQSASSKVVYNNTHDLDSDRPIATILNPSQSSELSHFEFDNSDNEVMMACKVCEGVGVPARYYHRGGQQGTAMADHLRKAHGVKKPVCGIHFELW